MIFGYSTIEKLRRDIIKHWRFELVGLKFMIHLENNSHGIISSDITQATQAVVVYVTLIQYEFIDLIESEITRMAKLGIPEINYYFYRMTPSAFVTLFNADENDLIEEASIVSKELQRRIKNICQVRNSQTSMKEFISPILFGAVQLYGKSNNTAKSDIHLICKKLVIGEYCKGTVDYIVEYKDMRIIITETMKYEYEYGIQQNLCQQVACIQESARRVAIMNNREYEEVLVEAEKIPSYGIVTAGEDWIFIRYCAAEKDYLRRLIISKRIQYSLQKDQKDEHRQSATRDLIRIIAGIIKVQVDHMDRLRLGLEVFEMFSRG